MKQFKLTFLLTVLMSMVGARTLAHSFGVANDDGVTIYYTKRSATEVAVTYQGFYYYSYSNEYGGNVVIPESVTFNGTTYSVTGIGDEAFRDCTGLTSVSIPNSVTYISDWAFYSCSGLTSITIPNSVTFIGYCAFLNCSGLTSVTIPNSVTSIGHHAFSGCSSLTSITIPNSVTSIGGSAFSGCSGLTSIAIPNSVTSIGDYAFNGCSSLTSVTIPNSVTSIGDFAFSVCTDLTSIIIPNSVTSIGTNAFSYNYELTSIVVEAGNTVYDSRNNCNAIIEKNSNKLIQGCVNTIIPNNVTSIGDYAFYGFYDLESITIPNSVTSIGSSAFYGCSNLTSVTVERTTPVDIDSYTFSNRTNATLYVPAGSKAAYEAADYWKEFKEIVEIDMYKLGDVNGDGVVDVSDYIGVANIILTGSIYGNNASSRPFVENEESTHEPQ